MRNSDYEYTSESTFEIEQDIPVVKKCYIYSITYSCKKCGEPFKVIEKESFKPLC